MPLADWIQKYPGVARLLQQEEDCLEGVSREEAEVGADPLGAGVQRFSDVAAWVVQASFLRNAFLERYGRALFFWAYCAPDVFQQCLMDVQRGHWDQRPFMRQGACLIFQGWLRVMLWDACALGTWCLHWTTTRDQPQFIKTDQSTLTHAVLYLACPWSHGPCGSEADLLGLGSARADVSPVPQCRVVRPAPICPCGAYMMLWV